MEIITIKQQTTAHGFTVLELELGTQSVISLALKEPRVLLVYKASLELKALKASLVFRVQLVAREQQVLKVYKV